jgi:hypothetical protein
MPWLRLYLLDGKGIIMGKITKCPDCGKLIALIFPLHDCKPKGAKGMTYSEIYEKFWDLDRPDIGALKLPEEEVNAWRIINLLKGRAGFDDWWGRMNDEIQDEIFKGIVDLLKE